MMADARCDEEHLPGITQHVRASRKQETSTGIRFEKRIARRNVVSTSLRSYFGPQTGRNHFSMKNESLKLDIGTGFLFDKPFKMESGTGFPFGRDNRGRDEEDGKRRVSDRPQAVAEKQGEARFRATAQPRSARADTR